MIIPLSAADTSTSGAKAGALGSLLRAGLPVPDGFVIPFTVHQAATRDATAEPTLDGFAGTERAIAVRPERAESATSDALRPTGLLDLLAEGLDKLGDVPVAVRSSADGEDTAEASRAGQYESVLAVRGVAEVAKAVQTCWESLDSSRAIAYRNDPAPSVASRNNPPFLVANRDESGRPPTYSKDSSADPPDEPGQPGSSNIPGNDPAMAVLVQRLVDAEVSGVMFTSAEGTTALEASWGLGPSVVGGTVTPDSYRVDADGSITRTIAEKRTRLDRPGAHAREGYGYGYSAGERLVGGLVAGQVAADDRDRATLGDAVVVRLAGLGQEAAALLGGPLDIEWAIDNDQIWILQARPITAAPPPAPAVAPVASRTLLAGTPASHGIATGTARIVRGPADFAQVRPGDILVCPYTDPAWTPLLRIAAGVVTDTGGALCHAAIVARELRLPAVVAIADATTTIRDSTLVTIDGSTGTVTITAT
ncbi:PEP/pyruvate-binding domain-containing protein [Kribbella deserti]|uniref:Phosphoenolpyruvate synthase n=1 Tax=Kribbella deserti TaxID=1926257 RepID=A0ABV6QNQ2_9ACTN